MPEHKGQTDELTQIQLPSAISHIIWGSSAAAAGGKVGLDVFMHYVGNGWEISLEINDSAGKNCGNCITRLDKVERRTYHWEFKNPSTFADFRMNAL